MNEKRNRPTRAGLSRRQTLRCGAIGAAGVAVGQAAPMQAFASRTPAKAKSVIQIFLWGGMSHVDTWDPKPNAGRDYTGEFSGVISTNVPGIQLGEFSAQDLSHFGDIRASACHIAFGQRIQVFDARTTVGDLNDSLR